jgi:hypothetical protein
MLLWQQPDLILTDIQTIFLTCSPEAEESAGTPSGCWTNYNSSTILEIWIRRKPPKHLPPSRTKLD